MIEPLPVRLLIFRSPLDRVPIELYSDSITDAEQLVELIGQLRASSPFVGLRVELAVGNVTWETEGEA